MGKYAIGHVLIKTNQLKNAADIYEKLGFTVTYRAEQGKSHNAFVYFRDGSFLELYNPKPVNWPDKLIVALLKLFRPFHPAMINRYIHYIASGEGITDYAMDSVPIEEAEANLHKSKQAGAAIGKIIKMKKSLSDGRKQTWWIALPEEHTMPFFMSAYNPPVICQNHELTHKNGVQGIESLVIDVPDLEASILHYTQLFPQISLSKKNGQCKLAFEKKHSIILRQAERFQFAEIHLITSKFQKEDDVIGSGESLGTTIKIKTQNNAQ